jgi:VanZ family protein
MGSRRGVRATHWLTTAYEKIGLACIERWVHPFFVFIIVSANARSMPPFIKSLYAFPGGDKLGHVVLMGALSTLANATSAVFTRTHKASTMFVATLIVTALVVAEEFSQQFFASRTMAWDDLACSLIGVWVVGFGGVTLWLRRRLATIHQHEHR